MQPSSPGMLDKTGKLGLSGQIYFLLDKLVFFTGQKILDTY